jgi:uncharacterized phage infection (PIP) family protein YhgE
MTTLTDTLPILDEAVPALPAKVEEVARSGDAFVDAARTTLDGIHEIRQEAEGLVARVAAALESLRERAVEAAQRLEAEAREIVTEVEQEVADVETETGRIEDAGEGVVAALEALEKEATGARDTVSQAHEEARTAIARWGDESQDGATQLQGSAGRMTAGLSSLTQAATEGQALVNEGVSALQEAMARLLLETQARLQQTANKLDELEGEQEAAVTAVASQLADGQRGIAQGVCEAIETAWEQDLDPAVEAATEALREVGMQLMNVELDTTERRESLDAHLKTAADSLPPIASGLEQARVAAQKVGLAWE